MLPTDRSPTKLEEGMLSRWTEEKLFQQTPPRAKANPNSFFFEGPPTANGRPGIHHVFARTVKDLFCVPRDARLPCRPQGGMDTHRLPSRSRSEKRSRRRVRCSTASTNRKRSGRAVQRDCGRESVWRYRTDWRIEANDRLWLDYSDPYVTYSNDYIERSGGRWRRCAVRGRLYRGTRFCLIVRACGRALQPEVAQHKDVKDPSAYVALDLAEEEIAGDSRLDDDAVDVDPTSRSPSAETGVRRASQEETEAGIRSFSRSRVWRPILGDDYAGRWDTVRSFPGSELVGKRYKRPLDWIDYTDGEHEIIIGEDFVSSEEGTGVVHMAPAFGADDYAAGKRNGLAFLQPVNLRGEFPPEMPLVGGKFVKDADPVILEELKRRGVLWKSSLFEPAITIAGVARSRCSTTPATSWFVRTTDSRTRCGPQLARAMASAGDGHGAFGEWLTNNIRWAVSRDRYWGTPPPDLGVRQRTSPTPRR